MTDIDFNAPEALARTFSLQHHGDTFEAKVLRQAFGCFPTGVVGVCASVDGPDGKELIGMAASSFVAVSLEPALVAFCIQWTSTTWPKLERLPKLGISVLGEGHNAAARQLASRTRDRFEGLALETSEEGAVFLGGASAWLDCSVHEVVPAGDHGIVLLRVHGLTVEPDNEPLVFHSSGFRQLLRSA